MPRRKKTPVTLVPKTSSRKASEPQTFKLTRTEQSPGDVKRFSTLLRTFDLAIGGGLPYRICTEIAGPTYVGKTTLALHLAGVAAKARRVIICPLETTDPYYVEQATSLAGHTGKIWYAPYHDAKGKPLGDEDMVDAFGDELRDGKDVGAAVFDSIGAISPIGEQEGSVADANMGRRAKIVANFLRKAERSVQRWREDDCNLFMLNHLHPNMGMAGQSTVGGKAIEYHCILQLRLYSEQKFDDGSLLDQGTIYKIRFRGDARNRATFNLFIKAGKGVHIGLTALHDCLSYELATKDNGRITMGGKSYGHLSKMIEEKWDDDDLYQPFIDKAFTEIT